MVEAIVWQPNRSGDVHGGQVRRELGVEDLLEVGDLPLAKHRCKDAIESMSDAECGVS